MPMIYRSILGLTEQITDIHGYSLFLIDEELYYIQQNHQEADNKTKDSYFFKNSSQLNLLPKDVLEASSKIGSKT